jgi:hypothetical protein
MGAFMHRDDRTSNLMFLLSLPLMATACPTGDEGDDSTTNNSSVSPTTDDTGPAPTSTGNDSVDPSATTGNDSAEVSTTGEPPGSTTEEPVDTTGEYSCDMLPPLMGPVSQACIDYSAKSNECYYDGGLSEECLAQYAAYCQYGIEYAVMTYNEACGMAYEDRYACLSLLTCEELADDTDDCTEASTAIDMNCMAM